MSGAVDEIGPPLLAIAACNFLLPGKHAGDPIGANTPLPPLLLPKSDLAAFPTMGGASLLRRSMQAM